MTVEDLYFALARMAVRLERLTYENELVIEELVAARKRIATLEENGSQLAGADRRTP